MVSFADLKKKSKTGAADLQKQLESMNTRGTKDERLWTPARAKDGNGFHIIRFLPSPAADGVDGTPFVKVINYSFDGPGGRYFEKSRTTIGEPDPVQKLNQKAYNSGSEELINAAKGRTQKKTYYSNIYVINDTVNPENNGKVFLFRYGEQIMSIIQGVLNPKAASGDLPVNPFNLWGYPKGLDDEEAWVKENGAPGADFQIEIFTKGDGKQAFPDYSRSKFKAPSTLKVPTTPGVKQTEDERLEAVWAICYSLQEFTDPTKFKSYEELEKRLKDILNVDSVAGVSATTTKASKREASESDDEPEVPFDLNSDDDEDLVGRFQSLMNTEE